MIALLISTTFILSLILAYHHFLRPPSNLAPGIPIVPLWLSLLPLFRTWLGQRPVGQDVHFERYLRPRLERFGCVVFFFGGRWSVLFSHPVAIKAITAGTGLGGSSTDEFPKAGNHIKIPFAVISALTGANIISESGPTWARFRKVISPHLGQFDIGSISAAAECFVQRLGELSAERRRARSAVVLPVNDLVQRFTMQALLSSLFIRPVKLFTGSPPQFHLIHSQVKTQIFDPFFLTFPAADQWPWALLFPSRERARKLIQALEYEILQVVAGGQDLIQDDYHARGAAYSEDRVLSILDARAAAGSRPDKVGEGGNEGEEKEVGVAPITRSMLNATESGIWTPREMIDNAKILFIAGHENTQQALNSIIWQLAKQQAWQSRMRDQIIALTKTTTTPDTSIRKPAHLTQAMLADMPLLRAFIYETLRLFPPIPQLVNRRCEDGRVLWLPVAPADRSDSGGAGSGMVPVSIPAGTYVGWSAYALHRSRFNTSWSSFGDDTTLSTHGLGKGSEVATAFLPERWGSTTVEIEATARRARDRGELMTFHAGARACLGQKFAMTELMIVVVHMLAAFEIRPQTDRDGTEAEVTMTPGGLLRPLQVPVELVVLA